MGDGHQPNTMGLYTHHKDSIGFLLKVGWPSPRGRPCQSQTQSLACRTESLPCQPVGKRNCLYFGSRFGAASLWRRSTQAWGGDQVESLGIAAGADGFVGELEWTGWQANTGVFSFCISLKPARHGFCFDFTQEPQEYADLELTRWSSSIQHWLDFQPSIAAWPNAHDEVHQGFCQCTLGRWSAGATSMPEMVRKNHGHEWIRKYHNSGLLPLGTLWLCQCMRNEI